jgi:hypothetical protein
MPPERSHSRSHPHSHLFPASPLHGTAPSPTLSPTLATATADPVADFQSDLDHSHHPGLLALFHSVYRRAFGAQIAIERVHDRTRQRQGIDVILHLPDGSSFSLDEKVRRLPRFLDQPWDDFFAEEYSDFDRKTPGWLLADHRCDFIAYAAPVAGAVSTPENTEEKADTTDNTTGFRWRIRLLDAPRLRDTARCDHERWAELYGRKLADNYGRATGRNRTIGYRTASIPIPWPEVLPFLRWQGDF